MNEKLFMGKIHVQNRNIVGDSVRNWLTIFLREISARFKKSLS